jgi:hypothetical protein
MRRYCRGTSAHNTLQIDGQDHCDMWSKFRMGRRGRPILAEGGCQPPFCWFAAAHDAYSFLGVPVTARFVAAAPGPTWVFLDWIDTKGKHQLIGRLRLHPDVAQEMIGDTQVRLEVVPFADTREKLDARDEVRHYRLSLFGDAKLEIERGWYCPNFGERLAIDVITGRCEGRGRKWIGWILQPISQDGDVVVEFRNEKLEVQLPNRDRVTLPIGPSH